MPATSKKRRIRAGVLAGLAVTLLTVGVASPAFAWGTVSFGPAPGCTGSASGTGYVYGSGAVQSTTSESGNFCLSKQTVGAALIRSGGGLTTINWAYDSVARLELSGSYSGSYHRWGTAVGTT